MDALPSSAINRESLSNIEDVTNRYPKLHSLYKAESLSCKLAQSNIRQKCFKRCTPKGNRHLLGLSSKELDDIRQVMFSQWPQFWRAPVGLEPVW